MKDGNPQLEDGFTRIANELFEDSLNKMPFRIPGPVSIYFAVMRETYGFSRKSAEISTERFKQITGISKRQNIHRAIKEAIQSHLINVIINDYKKYPTYSIQKNSSRWSSVIKNDYRNQKRLRSSSKMITPVIKNDDTLYVKETSKETSKETTPTPPESKNGNIPYDEIKNLWNRVMEETELSTIDGLSETRKRHLKARWNHSDKTKSLEWWEKYFNFITESDFLMGRTPGRKWKASFDWVINESNFLKIKEGNYQ